MISPGPLSYGEGTPDKIIFPLCCEEVRGMRKIALIKHLMGEHSYSLPAAQAAASEVVAGPSGG